MVSLRLNSIRTILWGNIIPKVIHLKYCKNVQKRRKLYKRSINVKKCPEMSKKFKKFQMMRRPKNNGFTTLEPKPSRKIGTANAICGNSLGLFRDYSLDHTFFKNKTFLFFKIEAEILAQVHTVYSQNCQFSHFYVDQLFSAN